MDALARNGRGNPTLEDVNNPGFQVPDAEGYKNFAKAIPAATAGLPGDIEGIVRLLAQASQGNIDVDAIERDRFLPDTNAVGEMMGADTKSTGFGVGSFFGLDPVSKFSAGASLAMPLAMRLAEKGGRKSALETITMGFRPDVAVNKVSKKPFYEMSRKVEKVDTPIKEKVIHPEELVDQVIFPLVGDRTDYGNKILQVGDNVLETPIHNPGGYGFPIENPDAVWALGKGESKTLANKVNAAQELGFDVNGIFVPAGHGATNFNTMMSDLILEQMKGMELPGRVARQFDETLRKTRPEWKGIKNPESRSQLDANGALRHEFQRVNGLKDFQDYGFPDPVETRYALTAPDLLHYSNAPIHAGGQSVSRLSGSTVKDPGFPHPTYPVQMGGDYRGRIGIPGEKNVAIPRELLFPKFTRGRREAGKPQGKDYRSLDRQKPMEVTDQQWLDNIMYYLLENIKK